MADDQDEHVQPQDAGKRNSPKDETPDAERGGEEAAGHADCYWNDKRYSDGGTVCDARRRFSCWNGKWVDVGNC